MPTKKRYLAYIVLGLLFALIFLYTILQSAVNNLDFWNSFYLTINVVISNLWNLITNPIFIIALAIVLILENYDSAIKKLIGYFSEIKLGAFSAKVNPQFIVQEKISEHKDISEEEKRKFDSLIKFVPTEICKTLLALDDEIIYISYLTTIVNKNFGKLSKTLPEKELIDTFFAIGIYRTLKGIFNNIWFTIEKPIGEDDLGKIILYPEVKNKLLERVYGVEIKDNKTHNN